MHSAQRIFIVIGCSLLAGAALRSTAEEPKKEDKTPVVTMVLPLGVVPGVNAKLTIRGLFLDEASEVRSSQSLLTLKVVGKSKAPFPKPEDAKRFGDTLVEVEAGVSNDLPPGEVQFTVVTPQGEAAPHSLLVAPKDKLVAKREPNGGFRDAQPIEVGQIIEGTIDSPRNVDVFRLELSPERKVIAEVMAARYGSSLDSQLTLYDNAGKQLATNDDAVGNDSRLELAVAAAGSYFLVLVDALDQGGPTYAYRLVTTEAAK